MNGGDIYMASSDEYILSLYEKVSNLDWSIGHNYIIAIISRNTCIIHEIFV